MPRIAARRPLGTTLDSHSPEASPAGHASLDAEDLRRIVDAGPAQEPSVAVQPDTAALGALTRASVLEEADAIARSAVPRGRAVRAKMDVRGLNLHYGDFHALKNIDLAIPEHQVTALIGPSGCGKSTFLRSLNRMNDRVPGCRVDGEVLIDEIDAYGSMDPSLLRCRVGMVFQHPNPFPMSVYDNVAYGPRAHGIRRRADLDETVEQSLRDAAVWDELKDRLDASALGLSGGQQQRLCIARALATHPEVLLMDEATSALDPISTAKIEDLVGQLRQRYTIVMVTHNMLQALRVAQKTAFFLMGEMVEAGSTEQIFERAADDRTADYVAGRFG